MEKEAYKDLLDILYTTMDKPLFSYEENNPMYREACVKSLELYDVLNDYLKSESETITKEQKQDILDYIEAIRVIESHAEPMYYLKGISDGIKLTQYFG